MLEYSTSRRALLGGAATAAAFIAIPGIARAATATPAGNPQLAATLKSIAEALLQRSPEQATLLGADIGPNAVLATRFSDITPAGEAADRRVYADARTKLAAIPRASLQGSDINNYDSAAWAMNIAGEGAAFPFGFTSSSGGTPYVVSQQNGTYNQAAEFLDSYHRVENATGAAAYISRLNQVAGMLDEETRRIVADAGKGVIPPDFIISNILGQQAQMRGVPAAQSRFVTSIAARTKKLGLPDPSAGATKTVESQIYPALDRQMAALKGLKANSDAGVWKFSDGEAYYQFLLKSQTTTSLSAAEIHKTGWEQNRAIEAEMDKILRSQGFTKGSVGERTAALTTDPRFIRPDTDAGRAAILGLVQGHIDAIRPLLPRVSKLGLKAETQVKRVPIDIQDGAALGYMNFASPDGKRPAIYYINLKSMTSWPTWTLASLTAHEAVPGHAWQGAFLAEHPEIVSPLAQLMGFNAFTEGWALYAEQLVDELGLYENDPFGRLGYFQAQRFRAVRLIVDTGLHSMRWTRDKAIDTMAAETGRDRGAVTSEIDRYCASPGQACGYKIGHNEIIKQRTRAKAALGAKWDVRDFNDALVSSGGVPLDALPGVVDRMVAGIERS
ncbi:hypothetical protein GCM10011529_26960 [Polymorphobacter glacialis]|uniref:DUF885 domain-containing protein n=1 Tax=Sandarakinorhabdus glacialis TaxID=1614636 RepID=A0A917EAG7_9SPHN|nr:DUF885 domain-containing protein [Polymorphobacter glacialis]GGE19056.1 hypothetical protein GCM10011529_26960 [Polymorphobacter glacialis]